MSTRHAMLVASCTGLLLLADAIASRPLAAAAPEAESSQAEIDAVFGLTKVWPIDLVLSAQEWEAMQPSMPLLSTFVEKRAKSVAAQLAGKSEGFVLRGPEGPPGGPEGPPGGFGGPPGGFGGPPGGPGDQPGAFRFPSPPLLEALDTNRDGVLDADEMAAAVASLKGLDKNGDGELSEQELAPALPGGGFGPDSPGGRGGPGEPGGRRGPGSGGPGMGGFGPGGPGGPGPGGPGGRKIEVLKKFDDNGDGVLDQAERAKARAFLKESRPAAGMFGRGPGGGPGRGPGGGPGGGEAGAESKPGKRLSPDQVAKFPDAGLYDPTVLRTLFFVFDNAAWEEELEEFHNTDVEVPATLIVDGKTYHQVGVSFRGNTSYMTVPRGKKRPLAVRIDLGDKNQRLVDHRSLNLLNSHMDPSLLRTVLFDHLAGQYLPAPRANLVRVVINGESWGIYVNEETFGKDFAQHWFGEDQGVRWRVPVNFSGAGALVYHGDDEPTYQRLYQLKSKERKSTWRDLIGLCRQLEQVADEQLETDLDPVLNVDRALWFLAMDAVAMDDDGYISRGSDYSIYQDRTFGRFHLMPRDSNETFRFGGGPGPGGPGPGGPGPGGPGPGGPGPGGDGRGAFGGGRGGGPGGARTEPGPAAKSESAAPLRIESGKPGEPPGGGGRNPPGAGGRMERGPGERGPGGRGQGGATLDPLRVLEARSRPVAQRLLSNATLRARYLAHLRTIAEDGLDWNTLGPVVENYRALIAEEVLADTRNLSSFSEFFDADIADSPGGGPFGMPPGLKLFVEQRRKYLLAHPEISKPHPAILSVEQTSTPQPDKPVSVVARIGGAEPAAAVILYYATARGAPFETLAMKVRQTSGQGEPAEQFYAADIPGVPADTEVYYYVEARAAVSVGTTTFHPARTELGAIHYHVEDSP